MMRLVTSSLSMRFGLVALLCFPCVQSILGFSNAHAFDQWNSNVVSQLPMHYDLIMSIGFGRQADLPVIDCMVDHQDTIHNLYVVAGWQMNSLRADWSAADMK